MTQGPGTRNPNQESGGGLSLRFALAFGLIAVVGFALNQAGYEPTTGRMNGIVNAWGVFAGVAALAFAVYLGGAIKRLGERAGQ